MANPTEKPAPKIDETKLGGVIEKILASPEATKFLIQHLRDKGDLHVMRGMSHMNVMHAHRVENARTAVVLDTETTGLEVEENEIIQLSMLKVLYDDQGIVAITKEFFDQLQDPGRPLEEKITKLTGHSDESLKGQKINLDEAAAFLADVNMIIAHNASFDRKFVEAKFPTLNFDKMDWACSINDVDWEKRANGTKKLELLTHMLGYVYPAHNAKADCTATGFVLSNTFDGDTEVMADIIESTKRRKVMILATGLQFGRQDPLKAAGFKWSPDRSGDAGDKCWHITISTPEEAQNAAKAVKEAFGGDVKLPIRNFTMKNAYSNRLPPVEHNGFETKTPLKAINAEDLAVPDLEQTTFGF